MNLRHSLIALALAGTASCTVVPPVERNPPAPAGAAVALNQSVRVGSATVTPVSVVEDSRCPVNARCVWAGRLVVKTRIEGQADGEVWQDTADMRLGESFGTHGVVVALVSGEPGRTTDRPTPSGTYRFTYEAR